MKLLAFFAVAALLVLSGCGTTYKYAGQTFSSEQAALAYQQQYLGGGVSALPPAQTKVGNILKIYYPNEEVIRANMITGNKTSPAADYIVKTFIADARKIKEAFEQRKSFDSVELSFTKGERKGAEPPNHVLYYVSESPMVNGWSYIGSKVPRSPVGIDHSTSDIREKYRLLVESVEALAQAEKVTRQAGK